MIFTQKFWHQLFAAGVLLKALNSVWETGLGLMLLFGDHRVFDRFSSESTKDFVGLYLLLHGLLNMFLAYNLYRNRLWAYPVMIGAVSLFLVYQIYRLAHTHSPILLIITIFDICFVYLTWHEYKHEKTLRTHHASIIS